MRACRSLPVVLPWLLLTIGHGRPTGASDHFLTIGGGYTPQGNQVSLEKNVLLFQQLLQERYPGGAPHDIFFADGNSPGRDLQYYDPAHPVPRVHQLLARLAREDGELGYQYRTSQVPGVRGESNRANLDQWFLEVGGKLPPGDRLFIYLTGHGGKGDDQNNHFYQWHNQKVSVRDLVGLLDKLPAEVDVVLVMVQCYSGGFANAIFQEGQSAKGLSNAHRCGFFATVSDRVAAGCTPDIDEVNYKEYSSSVWAAIRGQTRSGEPIARPDYDGDGKTSLAEAHAFTILASDTIDIPVKSSDAFLRAFSKNGPNDGEGLATADAPLDQMLAAASPIDRAVLQGLSEQLQLTGPQRASDARALAERYDQERKGLEEQRKKLNGPFDQQRDQIRQELKFRWPELANHWDPALTQILQTEPADIVAAIEGHPAYSEFARLFEEMHALDERRMDVERRWVKCQRLLRVVDNITLAANLPKVASPELQARWQQLLAAESGFLGGP